MFRRVQVYKRADVEEDIVRLEIEMTQAQFEELKAACQFKQDGLWNIVPLSHVIEQAFDGIGLNNA